MGKERLEWLNNLPRELELTISGIQFRLFHGRPVTPLFQGSDKDEVLSSFFTVEDKTYGGIICAYSHRPFVRLTSRGYAVNTGSVGNSLCLPRAHALLLGGEKDCIESAPIQITQVLAEDYDITKGERRKTILGRYPYMDIVKQNYKTEKNLVQRASLHEKYSTNKIGFGNWIVSYYQIKPNSKILELGCGNGFLWKQHLNLLNNTELILSDFSAGMIEATRKNMGNLNNISYKVIDIQDIPFEDSSFDIIIANSMLYYVPDIHKGLSEVRRVLKEDGSFYCSTYGEHGHTEFIVNTLKSFGVTDLVNKSFTLQNGRNILQEHFSTVVRKDYEDSLAITDIDDLLEYIYSCVSMTNVTKIAYSDMKAHLQTKMDNGILTIPKEYGMFICKA